MQPSKLNFDPPPSTRTPPVAPMRNDSPLTRPVSLPARPRSAETQPASTARPTGSSTALTTAQRQPTALTNPEYIDQLGRAAQSRASAVSNALLATVRNQDSGEIGHLLGSLSVRCKATDANALVPNWRNTLQRLPIIGPAFGNLSLSLSRFDNTLKDLDEISKKLLAAHSVLMMDVKHLEELYAENDETHRQLLDAIDEGRNILASLMLNSDPAVKDDASRLDRRIHDLELTAIIRLQNGPKIRIIQDGNIRLAEKLSSSVLNTIPLWKENLALAVTQVRQREGLALQNSVDDMTNSLLRSSADMLHQNSVEIARASSRNVVDIDTLKYTQQRLLETVKEVDAIRQDEAGKRVTARQEIEKINLELA